MKVYSDTLTAEDLHAAVPAGCSLELVAMNRPRKRAHGWTARLTKPGGSRWTNSGQHGAGHDKAASYDDHGYWMAPLFDLDADAVISFWDGREQFESGTTKDYSVKVTA